MIGVSTSCTRECNLGGTDEPKVAVQFSHSAALHQFFLSLGLYEDEKELDGYNYVEQVERKWRSSLFTRFASNVAVVLYKYFTFKRKLK